jgi:hypothetical protein
VLWVIDGSWPSQAATWTLKGIQDKQAAFLKSGALKAVQYQQAAFLKSGALKAVQYQQAAFLKSGALKGIQDQQKVILTSAALKSAVARHERFVKTGGLKPITHPLIGKVDLQRWLGADRGLMAGLRRGFVRGYEDALELIDRHWATKVGNPDYPHPVLFVVASFPMAVGLPLYEAAKAGEDDTVLLATLEPVITDSDFLSDVRAAVQAAPM